MFWPGDVLASLDTGALELVEAQAQVALTQARVALTQARVALNQAKLAQQTAEHNLKSTRDTEDALELALLQAQIDVRNAEHHLDETRDIYTWPEIQIAKDEAEDAEAYVKYVNERLSGSLTTEEELRWLATLDYAQARLATAESKLDAKVRSFDTEEVAIAGLQVEAAKKAEAQAQANLDELSDDLTIKELEVESAKESVEHAQQNVNLAQQNVNLAQKSLDRARKDLEEATIIAPFDGIVARVEAKEGEFLSPAAFTGTTIVEIIDLQHMELTARVDELDIARVKTGQKVMISVDAMPGTKLEGQVTFISPVAREPGVVLFEDEDEAKEYEVKVDFDIPGNSPIKAGMSATAEIIIE
jgi:multidrug resistance efflux pump